MTNQQILEKAIQKAAGYDISILHFAHPLEEYKWDDEKRYWYLDDITIPLFEVIYQHSFAKALWGEKKTRVISDTSQMLHERVIEQGWRWYLQQMVISNDPIKYLGENI